MVVYSHTITARLQYVIGFLSDYYGLPFTLTSDRERYLAASPVRINYSAEALAPEELRIHPHSLLFDKGVQPVAPEVITYGTHKALFPTAGAVPFDLFAAIFYLISRYEEYLPHQMDLYGRYAHRNAVAFREGFLQQPLIDFWLKDFGQLLRQTFPALSYPEKKFSWEPTYDIDIAWSYRHKGWIRNAGGWMKDLLTGRWKQVALRTSVLGRGRSDPFDCYNWLENLHRKHQLNARYFFLVAQNRSRLDKNISPTHPQLQALIRHTAREQAIGLHPSWQSGDREQLLPQEKQLLEGITGTSINSSRQHYLRFTLPHTFRRLLAAGIRHDYSMGYGTINGFRASTCTPFYWYDLEREAQTELMVHPFCFMDANAFYEEKKSAEAAAEDLDAYFRKVAEVQGTLCTIWHNPFLGTDPDFSGWSNLYEHFAERVTASLF